MSSRTFGLLSHVWVRWSLTALCCVVLAVSAQGGAWGDPEGHGVMIMTTSMFRAWDQYGKNGKRTPFNFDGRFEQIQVQEYFEIGLPKRWTLVANLPISYLQYTDTYNNSQGGRLGDLELSLRRRLNSASSPWAFSGQFTVTAPLYPANANPAPGNHQEDMEGRFLVGHGNAWGRGERRWFWDAEAAYRYRTGAPADQLRGDFTAGADIAPRVLAMGQVFSIKGLRNGEPITPNMNPNAQSDFDLYKAQGSLVFRFLRTSRVQAGWCRTLAGRNTGRGGTYVIGFWQSF